jgi:A118 family predicted phage portal protein
MWPPANLGNVLAGVERFDAWLTGDVDALSWLYATNRLQTSTSIWGQVRRFFWGTPTAQTTTQRPNKMHVPVAADIARMGAQVVFATMPDAHFGDMDGDADDTDLTTATGKAATERLTELLDDHAHSALLEAGELRCAHGGSYLKVAWDKDVVEDGPYLVAVATDCAVPTFRSGRLVSVIFWSDLAKLEGDGGSFKLLELHEKGRIQYGLYRGSSAKELGMPVPLTDHPDAAYLAELVDGDAGVPTGSDLITAVYIPWSKPNGRLRKDPAARDMGKSAFDGVEDLFDQIDEVYTSWMRDIRLGKARIVVPKGLLDVGAAGQGAIFDADREIFTELGEQVGSLNTSNSGKGSVDSFIKEFQPNIRYKEHMETLVHLLARTYQACGFSPQSFGEAGETEITATEVNARAGLTALTRQASVMYCRPELSHIFAALLDVDKFAFAGPGRGAALPDVEWSDSDKVDPKIIADTILALVNAEAISLYQRVKDQHTDWDDEQINAEADRIREDYSMLPENKANFLWAATAATGSATGGVDANSYGVKGVNVEGVNPAQAPRQAPNQKGKSDTLTPAPPQKGF